MKNIESQSVSKKVIEKIQTMIISGELAQGDKLPPERELTQLLDVGRPALREALKALELLGLIESRHGLGNYIVNNVNESYFKPMSIAFKLEKGTSQEILEMRQCLETYAVGRAAQNSTVDDIEILRDLLHKMIEGETPAEKAVIDRAFHFEIARISGNTLVYNTMKNISFLMDSFIEHSVQLSYFEGDSIENIYKEHTSIINAIEKHDAKSAVETMEKHLEMIDVEKID